MRAIKTLGLETAKKYANEGYLDVWGDFTNQRKAHCKVCGVEIPKGEGIGSYFWALQVPGTDAYRKHLLKCRIRLNPYSGTDCICGFRHQSVYVCASCEQKIRKGDKQK